MNGLELALRRPHGQGHMINDSSLWLEVFEMQQACTRLFFWLTLSCLPLATAAQDTDTRNAASNKCEETKPVLDEDEKFRNCVARGCSWKDCFERDDPLLLYTENLEKIVIPEVFFTDESVSEWGGLWSPTAADLFLESLRGSAM